MFFRWWSRSAISGKRSSVKPMQQEWIQSIVNRWPPHSSLTAVEGLRSQIRTRRAARLDMLEVWGRLETSLAAATDAGGSSLASVTKRRSSRRKRAAAALAEVSAFEEKWPLPELLYNTHIKYTKYKIPNPCETCPYNENSKVYKLLCKIIQKVMPNFQ